MSDQHFCLYGRSFVYFDHPYNSTRINERAVEVPPALYLLAEASSALEVGAVLPHYLANFQHTVVDLYEQFPGVINADVLSWQPECLYELIVCISTLDHLLYHSDVLCAVERMKSWLTPGGLLYVTLPYGQPPAIGGGKWLDALLTSDALGFHVYWRLDKVNPLRHGWQQVDESLPPRPYGGATPFANTVYLLLYGDIGRLGFFFPVCSFHAGKKQIWQA